MKIVTALGGNALLRPEQAGTYEELVDNVQVVCRQILKMIEQGHQLVLTHGNGPQVGNIALQQSSTSEVPENPLHVLDAMTQGEIGYLVQRELGNLLRSAGSKRSVITIVTQVVVAANDPSFKNPSKPIGPFYDEGDAKRLRGERGFVIKKIERKGPRPWRRVVPSPDPTGIVEAEAITKILETGNIVIAGGGGGIPVIKKGRSEYEGIDAVVDKDLCAEKLAESVKADLLLILTNVEKVKVDFGTPRERDLDTIAISEAKALLAKGQFPAGSMGPKVTACVRFVEWGGKLGIIASLEQALEALAGSAGTRVVPG